MPGTKSVRAGEKTPPILPFTTPTESDPRPRVCRRDTPSIDERFYRRIRPADDVFGTHRVMSNLDISTVRLAFEATPEFYFNG